MKEMKVSVRASSLILLYVLSPNGLGLQLEYDSDH